jgi:MFS family permease
VLAVLQQWCGINVIFNYAQEIFASAGYAVSDMLLNIVITGVVNCVFALVALATVERWGRRRLMLLGCAGLFVIYVALGVRGACMAVATTALWAACFLLTHTFPLINAAMGTGMTFWLYAAICLAGFFSVLRKLPETRGKSLEQIEQGWR